jgi:hypothetical protein
MIFADNAKWITRAENLSQDLLTRPVQINFYDENHDFRYGAHPGTTIIMPAALLFKLGLSGQSSLTYSIALLASLLTASIATICLYLRPDSLWWLSAAIIIMIHPLYFYGTPTNVIIGPTIALLFLLALVIYEHRVEIAPLRLLFLFSLVVGFGLSTRLPITVFLAAPLITFIAAYISFKRLLLAVAASVFFAVLFNPFYWFLPLEYIKTIILRTSSHIAYTGAPGFSLTPLWVLYFTPLTVISISVALLTFLLFRQNMPVAPPFLLTLLLVTAATSGLFLSAAFKTLRYFYPLIFIWDILLPLFLLRLSDFIQLPFIIRTDQVKVARQLIRLVVVGVITFSFGFLCVYNLILPGSQGLI